MTTSRLSLDLARRTVAYAGAHLADLGYGTPRSRAALAAKAEQATIWLASHCECCGAPLSDPDSVARRVGPECARRLAVV